MANNDDLRKLLWELSGSKKPAPKHDWLANAVAKSNAAASSPIRFKPTPKVSLAKTIAEASMAPQPPLQKFFKRKSTFVSFDWENDRRYKHLLQALDANNKFDFKFNDKSSGEIQSFNVGRVKAALTAKISNATHFLCIAGAYANEPHVDRALIGYRNWLNFEAHQAVALKKKIVVVRLHPSFTFPYELENANGLLVEGFKPVAIQEALNRVQ